MPELPDVEVYRRYFDAKALNRRIDAVHVEAPDLLSDTSPQGLGRLAHGHAFETTRRHGKYLFAGLDSGTWILMHFGMTGHLDYVEDPGDAPPHSQCLFSFGDSGALAYVATRKLGKIGTPSSPEAFVRAEDLGPDALTLDLDGFRDIAAGRRGQVKSWLMDQRSLAGIGNVYSDEILFQAGIHPRRPVGDLSGDDLARLHRSLRSVLERAIEAGADPQSMPEGFLLPEREEGGTCPRCGAQVASVSAAGRTAWFCPTCQPEHNGSG